MASITNSQENQRPDAIHRRILAILGLNDVTGMRKRFLIQVDWPTKEVADAHEADFYDELLLDINEILPHPWYCDTPLKTEETVGQLHAIGLADLPRIKLLREKKTKGKRKPASSSSLVNPTSQKKLNARS